ncbi:MAG: prolyl oligopeptidase family serine peptidase [Treponema sp.]|jgi:acetyl esterase/lipase|nr:prolyl oligopeptidase family serine peptidase [Treponema sp.]
MKIQTRLRFLALGIVLVSLISCQADTNKTNTDDTSFSVTFNAGEGGGAVPAVQQVLPNGTVTLPGVGSMTAPASKQFAGWKTDEWLYNEGKEFIVTKNTVFTAVWIASSPTRAHPSIRYVPASNPNSSTAHVLGLWLPDSGTGPFPVVIYVTGGAFMMSGNGQPPGYYAQARAKGYAVASIQHRVNNTPNNGGKFPNQTLDVLAAIRFLRAKAADYNLDPNRFVITGHSAGAYQSNMVAALSNSPNGLAMLDPNNVLDTLGNPGVSTKVLAAVSWAGLSDFRQLQAQHAASGINPSFAHDTASAPGTVMLNVKNESVTGLYDPKLDDAYNRSNPINYVHANMPPVILQCSRDDSTVPFQQSVILAEKITEVCGEDRVKLYVFNGQNHNTLENVTLSAEYGGGNNMTMIMNFIELQMNQ